MYTFDEIERSEAIYAYLDIDLQMELFGTFSSLSF